LSFMPAGIVEDEQPAFGVQRRDLFGQMIEVMYPHRQSQLCGFKVPAL
jgi:hypothetical protein